MHLLDVKTGQYHTATYRKAAQQRQCTSQGKSGIILISREPLQEMINKCFS